MKIGAILLAAGASRRMGRPKQLLPFNGTTLIRHICQEVLNSNCERLVVVLGANSDLIRPEIQDLPVDHVLNQDWDNRNGGECCYRCEFFKAEKINLDAFLLFVCDQPFLTAEYLNRLIEKYQTEKQNIIASTYADTIGVPAVFDKRYQEDLLRLKEQRGAKKLFSKYEADLLAVPFPEGKIDLDTPEDYKRFGK